MKERPILFNGAMVRAILDGHKTQTRRVIKNTGTYAIEDHHGVITAKRERSALATQCRFGIPGDRLWVRETFCSVDGEHAFYRANYLADPKGEKEHGVTWTPSIHMPRWACRILLEITSIRVERLQDISEADVLAEGFMSREGDSAFNFNGSREFFIPEMLEKNPTGRVACGANVSAQQAYRKLWSDINGAESWDANPWVWVVEFKRVMP